LGLLRNFSLCEHGADPGHTLANIIRKAEEVGGKSKKWGTRIRADMKSVWDQPDSYASSVELMRVCETYPAALKTYIMINKSEIMLTVLSRAGRRAAGRIRSDGSDQSGDTQSAESAHAVIDRVMGNKKHDAAALIDASLELFKYQFTQHVHGRMGRLHMYTLKKEYSHLVLDSMAYEDGDQQTSMKYLLELPHFTRAMMLGRDGTVGAGLNNRDRSKLRRQSEHFLVR
jgi:hypothetical protein